MLSLLASAADLPVPQLGAGTVILLVLAGFAILAMLRTILRLFLRLGLVLLGLLIGFAAWQHIPSIGQAMIGRVPDTSICLTFAAAAGIGAMIIARMLIRPLLQHRPDAPPPGFFGRVGGGMLALIPALLVLLVLAVVGMHWGSVSEIEDAAKGRQESTAPTSLPQRWKQAVQGWIPGDWLAVIDPAASKDRVTLAKWIAALTHQPDDRPLPRAVAIEEHRVVKTKILSDPELKALTEKDRYSALLRHPRLQALLDDPSIRSLLDQSKQ